MQGAIIAHTGIYKGARIPIEGELIIGKDPDCCNLILEGVSVKNRHCRITYREDANKYVVEPFIGGRVFRENGAVLSEGSGDRSFFPEETFRIGLEEDYFEFVFPEGIKQRKQRDEKRPDSVRIVSCPFPFETDGLDGWSDASNVSCWLKLKAEAELSESIAECAEWISFNRTNNRNNLDSDYWFCRERSVILLDEEELAKVCLTPDETALCKKYDISVAVVRLSGGYRVYDAVYQREFHVESEEWPGSVDDAATYGRWTLYPVHWWELEVHH